MGIENALSIDLSAFQFTPTATARRNRAAGVRQHAGRPTAKASTAEFVVYDSLGSPLDVRITTVLEDVDSTGARFRWIATSPDHHPDTGFSTVVGTGVHHDRRQRQVRLGHGRPRGHRPRRLAGGLAAGVSSSTSRR